MISVLEHMNFADSISFVKELNKARIANKEKWITFIGVINGKNITLKSFGLYLQIFRVNGLNYGRHCNNVADWKKLIESAI